MSYIYNKNNLKSDVLLYGITGTGRLSGEALSTQVEKAIKGGVTIIQLREKHLGADEIINEAKEIKEICHSYNVPLIINDSVEIALKTDADGVHLGQEDASVEEARKLLGENKIIGVSAHNVYEAVTAWKKGADYLGSGAVFHTGSKDNVTPLSHDTLKEICSAVPIPVVAIGGITEENIGKLAGTGIDGAAVISAVFSKSDIENAARRLREKIRKIL